MNLKRYWEHQLQAAEDHLDTAHARRADIALRQIATDRASCPRCLAPWVDVDHQEACLSCGWPS